MSDASRASSHRRAYDYLRSELLVDPSVQGTFLNEQEIAAQVGVSRTPVREALRALATEGLVELISHRGAFVPAVTSKQVSDLFEFRRLLECDAVDQVFAKQLNPTPKMMDALDRQRSVADDEGPEADFEFIALDREFHSYLLEAVGNSEISKTYDRISTRQRLIGAKALNYPARRRDVCEEHLAIVEALRGGDAALARQAVINHLAVTEQIVSKSYR